MPRCQGRPSRRSRSRRRGSRPARGADGIVVPGSAGPETVSSSCPPLAGCAVVSNGRVDAGRTARRARCRRGRGRCRGARHRRVLGARASRSARAREPPAESGPGAALTRAPPAGFGSGRVDVADPSARPGGPSPGRPERHRGPVTVRSRPNPPSRSSRRDPGGAEAPGGPRGSRPSGLRLVGVAFAAHGAHVHGVGRVRLDLLAQAGDADVDAAVARGQRAVVGELGEALAARAPGAGARAKTASRSYSIAVSGDLGAVRVAQAPAVEVERAAAEAQRLPAAAPRRAGLGARPGAARSAPAPAARAARRAWPRSRRRRRRGRAAGSAGRRPR